MNFSYGKRSVIHWYINTLILYSTIGFEAITYLSHFNGSYVENVQFHSTIPNYVGSVGRTFELPSYLCIWPLISSFDRLFEIQNVWKDYAFYPWLPLLQNLNFSIKLKLRDEYFESALFLMCYFNEKHKHNILQELKGSLHERIFVNMYLILEESYISGPRCLWYYPISTKCFFF